MNSTELALAISAGFDVTRLTPTVKTVTGTDPAANTECSDTVPTGKVWRLLGYSVTMVQGATQTPLPNLVLTDGTNAIGTWPGASAALSASTTARFSWNPSILTLSAGAAGVIQWAQIPGGMVLPAGYKVTTVTTGIGANSNYGAPAIWVIEYA